MLAFVRRKGSADTVSTSPSSSVDGCDDLMAHQQQLSAAAPKERHWAKRPLSLLQRVSSGSSSSSSRSISSSTNKGKDAFESAVAVAATVTAAAPAAVADKDASTLLATNSSLASNVVWKLAMRMSLHNESRFLQHLSRSMLSSIGSPHKHADKHHESSSEQVTAHTHSLAQTASQKLLTNAPHATTTANLSLHASTTTASTPSTLPPTSTPLAATGKAAPPCTPIHALPPLPPLQFAQQLNGKSRGSASLSPSLHSSSLASYVHWAFPGLRPGLSIRVVRAEVIASVPSTVTEYVIHVEDLHTKVFWITKKRFHELYLLRKQIKAIAKTASGADAEQLKFILELPFPRRRFRNPSAETIARRRMELEDFLRNLAALPPTTERFLAALEAVQLDMCSSEFIASLEKIDTTSEPIEPKWLAFDLFLSLNNSRSIAGSTCYKFRQAFANRCAVIEAAVCPECKNFEGTTLAADALRDLRTVVTSVEQHIVDRLRPLYADTMSLLDQSVDVAAIVEDCVFHAVEDALLVPLERHIAMLVNTTIDNDMEQRLAHNMERMRMRSQSEFGIPEHLQSDDDWGKSCHYLSMIDERPLPCDKIQELLRSALEIFKSYGEKNLEWRENSALTADDYLPIHIYVVTKCGLKRPLVAKEYLGAMIHPSKMLGEVGYFLTMFEVALKYIADM